MTDDISAGLFIYRLYVYIKRERDIYKNDCLKKARLVSSEWLSLRDNFGHSTAFSLLAIFYVIGRNIHLSTARNANILSTSTRLHKRKTINIH